ncbi:hypothetical protein JCM8547_007019 [Rhodosporidiobolus lusitaniae]
MQHINTAQTSMLPPGIVPHHIRQYEVLASRLGPQVAMRILFHADPIEPAVIRATAESLPTYEGAHQAVRVVAQSDTGPFDALNTLTRELADPLNLDGAVVDLEVRCRTTAEAAWYQRCIYPLLRVRKLCIRFEGGNFARSSTLFHDLLRQVCPETLEELLVQGPSIPDTAVPALASLTNLTRFLLVLTSDVCASSTLRNLITVLPSLTNLRACRCVREEDYDPLSNLSSSAFFQFYLTPASHPVSDVSVTKLLDALPPRLVILEILFVRFDEPWWLPRMNCRIVANAPRGVTVPMVRANRLEQVEVLETVLFSGMVGWVEHF